MNDLVPHIGTVAPVIIAIKTSILDPILSRYLQHTHKNYRPSKPVISKLPIRKTTVVFTAIMYKNERPKNFPMVVLIVNKILMIVIADYGT